MNKVVDFKTKRTYTDELLKQTGVCSEDLIAALAQRADELHERLFGKCETHWFIDTGNLPIFFETEEEADVEADRREARHLLGWRSRVHSPTEKG